jgi:HK97 family phage major capsid protein
MYELTQKLREYAVEKLGVAEDSPDEKFREAIGAALKDGELSGADFADMLAGEAKADEQIVGIIEETVGKGIGKAMQPIADAITNMAKATERLAQPKEEEPEPDIEKLAAEKAAKMKREAEDREARKARGAVADAAMAGAAKPRVKAPVEQYDSTRRRAIYPDAHPKSGRKHCLAGMPVMGPASSVGAPRRLLEEQSPRDAAVGAAVFRWHMLNGNHALLTEHERQLVDWALHEAEWVGSVNTRGWDGIGVPIGGIGRGKLTDFERKALLDDTTSGGSYAVPRAFDDAIVLPAVLYGELYPYVEVIDLAQRSVVDGSSWTDPAITSNTAEGTGITVATTTSMIGNLDTSIFTCSVGIELGEDWLSDTPVNFGSLIPQRMGIKLAEWLDNQIANGDGTTEPEGIFTKSGLGSGSSTNGTAGAITMGDLERMVFGVSKAERGLPGAVCRFVCNDTMYRRARSVPVGTSDDRRQQGLDHLSYTLLGEPVSIQDDIAMARMAYVNLSRYRMFRRLGSQFRTTNEGDTMVRQNTRLMLLRARFGGQLTTGAAGYKMTDLDSTDG